MASRSLGVLTLDLVAKVGGFVQGMDKAERASDKWRKQVQKDLKTIGTAVGTAVGATAAAVAGMTASTLNAAKEIERLSAVSGIGQEEFQRYAAGAKVVGIEQDKLADIFKDTNDKIGDFMQTGAGPMADFFEQIAPKVGVTADSFRKLSGPQALGLYVSSLEKAGVSQAEMTFYMEAIASDATALLPLLRNNAEGFKDLGDQAEAAGAILSGDTLESSRQLNAAIFVMEQEFAGLRNQVAAGLIPTLADLAGQFSEVNVEGSLVADISDTIAFSLKGLTATGFGAYAAIQLVGKTLAGMAAIIAAIPDGLDAIRAAEDVVNQDLNSFADEAATAIKKIMSAGTDSAESSERIEKIAGYMDAAATAGNATAGSFRAVSEESKKAAESIEKELTALERAAVVWGMNADEVKLYDLALQGANDQQLDLARSLLDTVSGMEQQKEAQENYLKVVADLRSEEEQRSDTLREQLAIIEAMAAVPSAERSEQISRAAAGAFEDSPDFSGVGEQAGGFLGEFNRLDDAERELDDWYSTQLQMLTQFREERADLNSEWDEQEIALKQQHEDALANIEQARRLAGLNAMGEFFGQLTALRETDSKKGRALAKNAAIAQATINAYTAATGAYASASAIPVVGWVLGPIAAAAALAAGIANVAAIRGQAHDGIMSVPASGTWNLEKGERVLPQDTAANLDSVLADIRGSQRGSDTGSRRGSTVVNQTINTTGRIDARTSNQMASDAARKQRTAQARLG